MKRGHRIIIKLVVFLLLISGGAAVNVAVAWGCAFFASPVLSERRALTDEEEALLVDRYMREEGCRTPTWRTRGWDVAEIKWKGLTNARAYMSSDVGYDHTHLKALIEFSHEQRSLLSRITIGTNDLSELQQAEAGIPMTTLSTYYCSGTEPNKREIPLIPVLPGFLINTLFYALVLWLLWSAPFAARRLIRTRRGRCVKCGYDLRHVDHEACPECGAER